MDIYETCRNYRERGIPLHVRNHTTAVGSRYWVYYGYAPPIAIGCTDDEARKALHVAAEMHGKLAHG